MARLIDLEFLSDFLPRLYAHAEEDLAAHLKELLAGSPSERILGDLAEALNDIEMNAAPGLGRTLFLYQTMLREGFTMMKKV